MASAHAEAHCKRRCAPLALHVAQVHVVDASCTTAPLKTLWVLCAASAWASASSGLQPVVCGLRRRVLFSSSFQSISSHLNFTAIANSSDNRGQSLLV